MFNRADEVRESHAPRGASKYGKGSRAERELIQMLEEKGYSVVRAAGSGKYTPDLLAFRHGRAFAFECKAWNSARLGIDKLQFNSLRAWQENTGMTTYVAWKVPQEGWYFIFTEHFEEQGASFTLQLKKAKLLGNRFEDIF